MSYSSVSDLGEPKPRTLPSRPLDPIEIRILGCLAEKQMSTPEYYPLTVNGLVAACNQKSNREPVMEVSESDVQGALDRLQQEKLVWKVMGGRAVKWEQNLDASLQLDRASKALFTLFLLRGAQTPGELRGRSDRLHAFESIAEVEDILQRLNPLVRELPRRPGQKESRWMHLLGGDIEVAEEPVAHKPTLEERVTALEAELRALKSKLGE